jgi:hypothetical protein
MTEHQMSNPAVRLNVLGDLEIVREPDGTRLQIPTSKRAYRILVLIALKPTYDSKELIEILWPDLASEYNVARIRNSLQKRLERELSNARIAIRLKRAEVVMPSEHGVIRREDDDQAPLTTDLEEFRKLAESGEPADWKAALALVRGPIAAFLPATTPPCNDEWRTVAQSIQVQDITGVLKRLEPSASNETLKRRRQEVLEGHYVVKPSEPGHVDRQEQSTVGTPTKPGPSSSEALRTTYPPHRQRSLRAQSRITRVFLGFTFGLLLTAAITIYMANSGGNRSYKSAGLCGETTPQIFNPSSYMEYELLASLSELNAYILIYHNASHGGVAEDVIAKVALPDGAKIVPNTVCLYRNNDYSQGKRYAANPLLQPEGLPIGNYNPGQYAYITLSVRLATHPGCGQRDVKIFGETGPRALFPEDWVSAASTMTTAEYGQRNC